MHKSNMDRAGRMYVRIETSVVKVKYGVAGREVQGALRAAKNISGGGIRIPVDKRLRQGAKLALELKLPRETVPIQAQVDVIWSARFPGRRTYEASCQFTKIDPLDRGKIIRYIHEVLRHRKPR